MDLWDDIEDDIRKDGMSNEVDFINHRLLDDVGELQRVEQKIFDEEKILMEQLELEQPIISRKSHFNAYSVEREYVNSKEYHDKFERMPVNRDVQQRLYIEAGRLLEFVDGQEEERLLAVNARTGDLLVDNFNREGSIKGTGFTIDEARALDNCKDGIILLHNHSLNGRPSAQDMLTYLKEERVKVSLVLCHDGTVYGIYGVSQKFPNIYGDYLEQAKLKTDNLDEAKRLATTQLYLLNDKLGNRHKLFIIEKL
jgi:hypothetical protein